MTREEEIEKGSAEIGAQYWHAGEINEYNFFKTRCPHDMFVCGAQWADAHPKNPYHKYPEEEPPCFGDYLVVVDDKNKGRRWAFKCWYGNPADPFDDNPSKGWLLDENEIVSYWMEIPDIKKD